MPHVALGVGDDGRFAVAVDVSLVQGRVQVQRSVGGRAGLEAKALSLACYESAATGKPVSYEEVLKGEIRQYQAPIDDYWKL